MKQKGSKEELFILQKMIEGDESAFKYFFDSYYDSLCNFVNIYTRDETLSEEIIQDIFVSFWEKREMFQLNSSVKSYLYAASKNKSLNYLRDQSIKNRITGEIANKAEMSTAGADKYLEVEELRRIIGEAVEGLPPKCREIYQLSRDNEMTNKEIADKLGISIKTVENQMTIAIKKLRDHLRPWYDQIFILFLSSTIF